MLDHAFTCALIYPFQLVVSHHVIFSEFENYYTTVLLLFFFFFKS
jgi:hypothetical protein